MQAAKAALQAFGKAASDQKARGNYEPRQKGRNRVRSGQRDVYHDVNRFTRKTKAYGSEYRPGKLFKGHRI